MGKLHSEYSDGGFRLLEKTFRWAVTWLGKSAVTSQLLSASGLFWLALLLCHERPSCSHRYPLSIGAADQHILAVPFVSANCFNSMCRNLTTSYRMSHYAPGYLGTAVFERYSARDYFNIFGKKLIFSPSKYIYTAPRAE